MSQFQVTKELIFDAAQVGELLEAQFGAYLLPPPEGLYMPHTTRPVLQARQYYYQLVKAAGVAQLQAMAIASAEDIRDDVFDANDNLVVSKAAGKFLRAAPTLPVRGMLMVAAAVDWTLQSCAAWTSKTCPPISQLLEKHLKEEYRERASEEKLATPYFQHRLAADPKLAKRLEFNTQLMDQIEDMLASVRYDVQAFVGPDTWVLHFHKLRRRDLIIERTIDFRIYDWERRMSSGEWS